MIPRQEKEIKRRTANKKEWNAKIIKRNMKEEDGEHKNMKKRGRRK